MRFPLPLVLLSLLAPSAWADEQPALADIQAALAKPILEEGAPLNEVKAFCEARVLRLPAADGPERKSAEAWEKYIAGVRKNVLDQAVFRGEAAKWRDFAGGIEWQETIDGGEGYRIKKLRLEVVPGLWIPALLYEPTKLTGKTPVFLNVNGHDGAGKTAGYKQIRCINLAKRGILALNLEWLGMGQLRGPGFAHYKLNQLDLCGTSGVAPFYLSMKRGLDILLAHEHADPSRVGVAGLSGGGWQTIFFSSLDTRVTLANPVAGYSSFLTRIEHYSDLGDSEQTPVDLAATGDYAHLTAMLAPRVALLTYNEKDNCCFAAPHALPPLLEAARPVYQLLGKAANLHDHINYDPGNHNFERDNREALYKVIGQHWYAGDAAFSATEIPSDAEVKKADELTVQLPADNLDLAKLATRLMSDLPRGKAGRQAVRAMLRLPQESSGKLVASATDESESGKTRIRRWKLQIDDQWTVPAVQFSSGGDKGAAIVLADAGRAAAGEQVQQLLKDGWRVVAVDPFYFGESKIKSHAPLFALLVSSVGERPLGVQAAQLQRIAQWLKSEQKAKQVRVLAAGPRTSLIALSAAASDDKSIDSLRLQGSLGSLKEVIEQGGQVDKTPEQFCFGLLATADIRQLVELVTPRDVQFVEPSERVKKELAGLKGVLAETTALRPVRIANPVGGHIHPAVCLSKKGTLIVTYGQVNHRDLRITRSEDGGQTWAPPAPFAPTEKKTYYPGSLTTLANGQILHAWNRWSEPTNEKEPRSVLYSLSGDDGATWSEPQPFPRDDKVVSVIRHSLVELAPNKWLFSLSDKTLTFEPATASSAPFGDGRAHGLVPIVRTPKGTYISGAGLRSTDEGQTWVEITKLPNLKEQGWRHELVALANGWLLASEIPGPGVGGDLLRYVISKDDGVTWDQTIDYYNPGRPIGGRACPRTVQLDADNVGVVFYDVEPQQPGGPALFFLRIPLARLDRN